LFQPGRPRYALWFGMRSRLTYVSFLCLGACGGPPETKLADVRPTTERAQVEPEPLAELEAPVVARSIRGNENRLRECFAGPNGPVRGFMRMAFRVKPSGEIDGIEVESSNFAEAGVFECLSERIASLHFDPRPDARLAHWTFASGISELSAGAGAKGKRKKRVRRESSEEGVVIDEKSRGSLSPEEVEDVVHAGFGLFAHCYREGIDRHPLLSGVVRLRMVIGRDGLVDEMRDAGSDIGDAEIIDCVAEGFFALRFPKPRKGTVRLSYRIVFDAS
jgi:hypothetical protein